MTTTMPAPNLYSDKRGAVMVTGLFMSCFLIGSLWFVMGIGDTLVFRDKMQEAADVGAFSSAALHAKGMNFISLCNLVLLAAVTIHIILGIIHDILLAICIVSLGFGCGAWIKFRKVYTGYFKVLKVAGKAIHVGELVASYAYPAIGFIEGAKMGQKYGNDRYTDQVTVLPLSVSLVPGVVMGSKREGLPVEAKPMNYLCEKIVKVGFNAIFGQALSMSPKSPSGAALSMVKGWIGGVIKFRYCNDLGSAGGRANQINFGNKINDGNKGVDEANKQIDKENASRPAGTPATDRIAQAQKGAGGGGGGIDPGFDKWWGSDGPMVVYGAAGNGSMYHQTWAMNAMPELKDTADKRVAISGYKKTFGQTKKPVSLGYIAQSEFYFDCDDKWNEPACNFEDNATFQIKWRARLTRVAMPALASTIASIGVNNLGNYIGDTLKVAGNVSNGIGKILGLNGANRAGLAGVIDGAIKVGLNWLYNGNGMINDTAAKFDPQVNTYH